MPKIRICHVQVLPILSGVQRAMLEIFKQLDRDRYEIHVACQGPGPLTDELQRRGIRWHAVPSLGRPIRPLADWRAYQELLALFRRHQFDLVHTHSSKPGVLGRVAARRAGVPAIVHCVQGFAFHEFSPWIKRWGYSQLERWAGSHCDRVVFVNHEERQQSIVRGLLPERKCQTVYNGIDLAEFAPAELAARRQQCRAAWQLATDEVAVVFAGRLEPQKQPQLLAAIAHGLLRHVGDRPWRLIVAGDGPLRSRLANEVADRGVGSRVSLVGWQTDSRAVLAAADIVLLPSLFEGLPLALLEAQAAGLPVVASNVKGNREVVTPGTGFLCPPRDPAAFATALSLLIGDAWLRGQQGRAARRQAERKFDTRETNAQIVSLYEQLLGLECAAPSESAVA